MSRLPASGSEWKGSGEFLPSGHLASSCHHHRWRVFAKSMPVQLFRDMAELEFKGQPNVPGPRRRRMAIIEARGLGRVFKSRRAVVEAVVGVDLTVEPGEIVGFLGPNGAGKTTTFR